MAKEEVKEKKARFEVTEITTQTAPVIKDNEKEEYYNELTMLCYLANKIEKIEKQVTG